MGQHHFIHVPLPSLKDRLVLYVSNYGIKVLKLNFKRI